jgi:hypothetical protein
MTVGSAKRAESSLASLTLKKVFCHKWESSFRDSAFMQRPSLISTKIFKYTVTTPEAYIALQGIFYTDRLVVIIVLTNKL